MNIVILDSGFSNLSSIYWAIKRLGYNPIISFDKKIIKNSDKLIFPGIGTPSFLLKNLKKYHLIDVIKTYKNPILGICLGMHLFFKYIEESKNTLMLDIFNNKNIYKFRKNKIIIPHIGWNKVYFKQKHPLFNNLLSGDWFYFIHSYFSLVSSITIAKTCYGFFFSSVVQKNNFFGVQFHPEKSGKSGMILLKNFLEIY
ncbi:MAG: imidazole glycerol phosphate synthase subunit HisH [Buchnera aphidicola (Periphyllus lyropictus)]|uniref:imidazole glycerol phosphate synthase subunit HisH n=1 Tax=Buchnera aphidicola TaxID=9 RepID=UPI001EB79480|nr:imidazole glycerol phosphate synthase subunit HisH [Buchnera aphidicola]NIH16728.1 imidazole glycerol phosphate synthase subunit HisH [Buchnera aphidicola (Periphyllus lyropictus)]USS94632.1 imidazole glycerol phosphate synthase subunit HisH [Buchnera aphidicola (Periphyllus lyropictus)]